MNGSKPDPRRVKWMDWAFNPSAWVRDHRLVEFKLDAAQEEFLDCGRPDIMLNWCRQYGKTTMTALKVSHWATFHAGSVLLIVSATQRQAGILQGRVVSIMRKLNMPMREDILAEIDLPEEPLDPGSEIVRCSVLSMEIGNRSQIISVPASADTVRGYTPDGIVLDEDSRIPDPVIDAVRPMRASHPVWLVSLSTPNGKRGHFYREWSSDNPVWWRSRITADMVPRITPEWLAEEKLHMTSDAMFRQEYMGDFIDLAGSLFTAEMIANMTVMDDVLPIARPWVPSLDA